MLKAIVLTSLFESGFLKPVNSVPVQSAYPDKGRNPGVGKQFPDTDYRLFSGFSTPQKAFRQGKHV